MSILKNEEPATRASAMIPVSLNISLDGISGFQMTQLFTIGENFLPYNYLKVKAGNPFASIGFAIVGLTHTIENNQWITSLRTNMAYLRNSVNDYTGKTKKGNHIFTPEKSLIAIPSIYKNTNPESSYPNLIIQGSPVKTDITVLNHNLLDDINKAAAKAGVKVSIDFGQNNYTVREDSSRHYNGSAVDIDYIDGLSGLGLQPVSPQIKPLVKKFTDQLEILGYNKDAEGNNKKAYLSFDFKENGKNTHENHVHVSNKGTSSSTDKPKENTSKPPDALTNISKSYEETKADPLIMSLGKYFFGLDEEKNINRVRPKYSKKIKENIIRIKGLLK